MPELPSDSVDVERLVRASLVALFTGIEGLPHVIDYAVYVSGEAEYVRQFGFKHPSTGQTEFRLLEVAFADFTDGDVGCRAKSVYSLNYSLTLVVSPSAKRPDGTASTDDFARFVLTMRQKALDTTHLAGYDRLRVQTLEPRGSSFGPDETLNLRMAHVGAFSLSVEVTPS